MFIHNLAPPQSSPPAEVLLQGLPTLRDWFRHSALYVY